MRATGIKNVVFRIITIEIYTILCVIAAFASLPGFSVRNFLLYYLTARIGFLALYELGYFVNDFWSEKREATRLGRPFQHVHPPAGILFNAVFSRLCAVSAIILLLYYFYNNSVFGFLFILIFTQIIFMIHNWLFIPHRIITFAALYFCQYSIAIPFIYTIGSFKDISFYALLVIPVITGYAVIYGANKYKSGKGNILDFSFGLLNRSLGNSILRIAQVFLGLEIMLALIFSRYELSATMLMVLFFLIGIDAIYISARFLASLHGAIQQRNCLYHIHTKFSHDGTNSLENVAEFCQRERISEVFINDHAEDFDAAKFNRLKEACSENYNNVKIQCGLEYEILGQHFLCNNMQTFVEIQGTSLAEITKLKNYCSEIIWAHPDFKIRKMLLDSAYRKTWYEMMRYVDGMEIINRKGGRGNQYAWRHIVLSFFGSLFKNLKLTIGIDAHTPDDLNIIEKTSKCAWKAVEAVAGNT